MTAWSLCSQALVHDLVQDEGQMATRATFTDHREKSPDSFLVSDNVTFVNFRRHKHTTREAAPSMIQRALLALSLGVIAGALGIALSSLILHWL